LDNVVYDIRQKMVLNKQSLKDIPIVIIDVDEKSLKAEGHWPWPRDKMADLINHLKKQGVVVIAIDQLFPEPEPNVAAETLKRLQLRGQLNTTLANEVKQLIPGFDNDRLFADSIKQVDTILGIYFNNSANSPVGLLPKPLLKLTTPEDKKLIITNMKSYIGNIPLFQYCQMKMA
jgi:adenylate cyclase